mmetsp:Transcript_33307/g.106158  ORF Transcript_33307/g.106158 Transcript_33307/m.106158 type:complete len:722 (-) Transcript_33307:49-2214(-)
MRVVGLISGGKDSIWNLHYCRHFGHELACVANLAPPEGIDELDSYMYQTVASDLISAIAEALGVPLVRRVIAGAPKAIGSQAYSPQDGDEVEDLTLLLQEVLEAHPDVQAVSCGAILSNYQRLRVENVCGRLGLKVFAFMWMQEQPALLQQMIDAQIDARIAKVASMGLTRKHVGESILNPVFANHLFGLGQKWGVHVCGEGGEYESTVVDAPLYRRRVIIDSCETIDHPDGNDGVAWLHVNKASLAPKLEGEADVEPEMPKSFKVLEPYSNLQYYQDTFALLAPERQSEGPEAGQHLPPRVAEGTSSASRQPSMRRVGASLIATSSLDAATFGIDEASSGDPAAQCDTLLAAVAHWLAQERPEGRGLRDVVLAEVQVRDLGCFEAMNAVYSRHFAIEPPPRLCIQTPLPEGRHLRVRLLLQADPKAEVERLRVQSFSTWAMACIGPYSQAARVGAGLLTAGVLGLVPHRMTFPTAAEARLATGAAADRPAWEAELWMTMRSLSNMLREMRSSLAAPCLVQVYVAQGVASEAAKIEARVLDYIRREDSGSVPLVTCAVVPRLPKDGLVEVAFTIDHGDQDVSLSSDVTECKSPSGSLTGAVAVTCRLGPGDTWFACADFSPADLAAASTAELRTEDVRWMAEQCVGTLWARLERCSGGKAQSASLLVQYSMGNAHEAVTEAVDVAVGGADRRCTGIASYMPVTALSPGAVLRLTAFAASDL